MAQTLAAMSPKTKVVEVDDIKRERYGGTEYCDPGHDFPEAGRRVKAHVEKGFKTIGVEAFCERAHVQDFLRGTGHALHSPWVSFVWLRCSLETSIRRKAGEISESVIRMQHKRYERRYRPVGELEVETDELTSDDIARLILDRVKFR